MSYLDIVYPNLGLKTGDYTHQLVDYLVNNWLNESSLDATGKPTKSLLDVGAGKGAHAAVFSRYYNVTTIDRHDDAKETFETLDINANVVMAEIDKQPFPLPENSFDVVFTKSVIEHVENWEHFLREIFRVLKPGGSAIVMTPNWKTQKTNIYQLPFIWRMPVLKFVPWFLRKLPESLKWRDKHEREHRLLIRFSKETMLLAIAKKQ